MGMTDMAAQSLFWCILFNLGFAMEQSAELHESSANPLDCPVLVGPKGRVRKISNSQKYKIASMASRGQVFHSPAAVIKGMNLLGKKFMASAKPANKWIDPLASKYLHRLQEVFRFSDARVPIYSVAWDATRLSTMDALATTIYNPALRVAEWCPPQANITFLFTDN